MDHTSEHVIGRLCEHVNERCYVIVGLCENAYAGEHLKGKVYSSARHYAQANEHGRDHD